MSAYGSFAPLPPPQPPPATLTEFVDRYTPIRVSGRAVGDKAARFTAQWVAAADAGAEPPPMEDLDGDSLWAVGEILDELMQHSRMYVSVTPLLFKLIREYRERVEIVTGPRGAPGELLQQPPTGRLRPRPGPEFSFSRRQLMELPALAARGLQDLAASGEAAARFLRSLAAAVNDGSGMRGQDPTADTTALEPAGRQAVAALLEAGIRAARAEPNDFRSIDLSRILAAWQDWARAAEAPR